MKRTDELSDHNEGLHAILATITTLISSQSNTHWARRFTELSKQAQVISSQAEASHLASTILTMYGGMGSFNDLVLFNGSVVDAEANRRLDRLRKELFEAARSILVETRR